MEKTCKDLVRKAYQSRMKDISRVWSLHRRDPDACDSELGTWEEYGLSFDYVPKDTFTGQKRGYFRYQLSWGGPSEEFRFYVDETLDIEKVEFWYLDWFDGAKVVVGGRALQTWREIWEEFREIDLLRSKMREAQG